ncbi:uncharacterized protein LOC130732427 [Lotus japonicus]|uniref:uncharacterized protein LOC130732427 n=1 Tax=Lotus japonicus TaxID=34305 RepID=UPI0025911380|nr:uncharacterized protein LOC130732427 [Lotus japonicus]
MEASKSNFQGRSNSLPSRPHPLILECNQHLESLRASSETSSSNSSFLSHNIRGLQDLIECVEKLIQLPLTQDTLLHEQKEKWNFLDGSLRLLDVCASAKDALLHTKECTRELQSIIRRRRGGELELMAEAKKFLTSRKVVKRAISKSLSKNCNFFSSTNKDHHQTVALLQDVEVATLSSFQKLMQFISGTTTTTQSKSRSWIFISKMIQPKRVACSLVEDESEFAQGDVALQSFIFSKNGKVEEVNNLQNQLEKLELCIQDIEEGLEFLFRRLIKIRVSLLNILNH